MIANLLIFITCIHVYTFTIGVTDGACTWPPVFVNSTWHDNTKGTLTFTDTKMSGYSFAAYGSTISQWECVIESEFTSAGLLVMKSQSTFNAFSSNWTSYLCVRLLRITDVSYYYYHLHDRQSNAAEERLHIDPDSGLTSSSAICNTSILGSGPEFHVLIKQGFEDQAKISCPEPFLGRFDYVITDSDGTTFCDEANTTYHLNICTDKTTMTFDDPCSRSLAYADGNVYCVATVTAGANTFLTVYNPQETVDSTNTYRFSCFAISEDSLTATVVPNNCTDLQAPTVLGKDHLGNDIGASIVFTPLVFCKGGCSWPANFQNSNWQDNTRGDLTFTSTTMTGWSFTSYGAAINNWECLDTSDFATDGILLLKSTDTFSHIGSTWVSYLCLQLNEVTADSYYYYQNHPHQPNAAEERVKIHDSDTLTTRSEICSNIAVPASEFHFMVKSGQESSAKQYCPPSLLAKMDYTYTGSDSSVACDSSEDNWDVCTDRMIMTFNYSTCPQQIPYSASGIVWCMCNITSTYEYVVVYNTDASLTADVTYRFSCFVISTDGSSASVVYNNCTSVQTPTSLAETHDGTSIGALLTMTATETCPFLGPTTAPSSDPPDENSSLIPIIVGVIVGVLAVALIVAVTVYCLKRKKANIVHQDKSPKGGKGAPVSNGTATPVTVKDLEKPPISENPALTVEPSERNTLTPLPQKTSTAEPTEISPRNTELLPPIKNGKAG